VRDILVRSSRDPLCGLSRDQAVEHIRSCVRGRVREAWLYGSFARDELDPDSDIDCMLVADTDLPFPERGRLFDDLRDRLPSLEILVYTPEEFGRLTGDPSPGFWQSVVRELVRIV
jgi:predicted nucleotidyltransferase